MIELGDEPLVDLKVNLRREFTTPFSWSELDYLKIILDGSENPARSMRDLTLDLRSPLCREIIAPADLSRN